MKSSFCYSLKQIFSEFMKETAYRAEMMLYLNFMAIVMIIKGYKEVRLNTATANAAKAAE